jgi:HEAT repeat protein
MARIAGSGGLRPRLVLVALAMSLGGFSGCANYIGTTALSFMKHAQESPDPNVRNQAYARLADPLSYTSGGQKEQAVAVLSAQLVEKNEPVASRAQICRTLGELGLPEARPALLRAVDDEDSLVRAEACRALGKLGNPEDAATLSRIMAADTSSDCRLAAIEGLGLLKTTDLRVMEQLIDGMQHADPGIRLACYRALKDLSGKKLDADVEVWKQELASRQQTQQAPQQFVRGATGTTTK